METTIKISCPMQVAEIEKVREKLDKLMKKYRVLCTDEGRAGGIRGIGGVYEFDCRIDDQHGDTIKLAFDFIRKAKSLITSGPHDEQILELSKKCGGKIPFRAEFVFDDTDVPERTKRPLKRR